MKPSADKDVAAAVRKYLPTDTLAVYDSTHLDEIRFGARTASVSRTEL